MEEEKQRLERAGLEDKRTQSTWRFVVHILISVTTERKAPLFEESPKPMQKKK